MAPPRASNAPLSVGRCSWVGLAQISREIGAFSAPRTRLGRLGWGRAVAGVVAEVGRLPLRLGLEKC